MTRLNRLRRSADFDRVLRSGHRIATPSFTLFVRDNERGVPRVGYAVSGKLGNAAVRNRIKRRLRALVDPLARSSRAARDVVIVAKPPAMIVDAARLSLDVTQAWRQGVDRA